MKTTTFNIETINTYLPYIEKSDAGKTFNEKLKITLSISLFVTKVVSLEQAAQLADKSISDFVDILISKNVYWHDYKPENMDLDNAAIKKYFILSQND